MDIHTFDTTRIVEDLAVGNDFDDVVVGNRDYEKVHIRIQQRSGKKSITTVTGLDDELDLKRICKAFKKNFNCNGVVKHDDEVGAVIQLSGDQRTKVKSFLVDQEICTGNNIVVHGF